MSGHAATARFRAEFPNVEPCAIARAPGRVNLIGEHIDYNDGVVLPIAINLETRVVIGRTSDGRIRVRSASQTGELNYDVADIPATPGREWDAYVRGVMVLLAERGVRIPACAIWIESDIPLGSGLSSSAALEIGLALAVLAAAGTTAPLKSVADICRAAEIYFARVPCGIMDQYACAMAREGHALAIDCRDRTVWHVPWPASNPAVLIVDTGIKRSLAASAYAERVRECDEAFNAFESSSEWRDVTLADVTSTLNQMPDLHRRRARHIVTEIQRAQAAISALEQDDCDRFGELMRASHASLRDDYEVSLPAIDQLVEQLCGLKGVYGAKLTGAGFGGCVVALVDREALSVTQPRIDLGGMQFNSLGLATHVTAPDRGASWTTFSSDLDRNGS